MTPKARAQEALLPCPLCGGKAEYSEREHNDDINPPRPFMFGRIECYDCGATVPEQKISEQQSKKVISDLVEKLYRSWNRRPSPAINQELAEALEICLKQMRIEDMIFQEQPALGSAIQIATKALEKHAAAIKHSQEKI